MRALKQKKRLTNSETINIEIFVKRNVIRIRYKLITRNFLLLLLSERLNNIYF